MVSATLELSCDVYAVQVAGIFSRLGKLMLVNQISSHSKNIKVFTYAKTQLYNSNMLVEQQNSSNAWQAICAHLVLVLNGALGCCDIASTHLPFVYHRSFM